MSGPANFRESRAGGHAMPRRTSQLSNPKRGSSKSPARPGPAPGPPFPAARARMLPPLKQDSQWRRGEGTEALSACSESPPGLASLPGSPPRAKFASQQKAGFLGVPRRPAPESPPRLGEPLKRPPLVSLGPPSGAPRHRAFSKSDSWRTSKRAREPSHDSHRTAAP